MPRLRVSTGLTACVGVVLFAAALWIRPPGSSPTSSPAACRSCHQAEWAAWSDSRHAHARSNAVFEEAWRHSRDPWCLTCHAADASDGVGCASCHLEDGVLVGSDPSWSAWLWHPIRPRAAGGAEPCAGCHQFAMPTPASVAAVSAGTPHVFGDLPAQDTVAEWERSAAAAAGQGCSHCHDPHAAPGGHDRALVRGAIDAEVRVEQGQVFASLTAVDAAHAVPTGDPFRRLVLTICPPENCDAPYARHELRRRTRREGDRWVVASDTRIGPATDGSSATITFTQPLEQPLPAGARWTLTYRLADPRHSRHLPDAEQGFLVAEGLL